MILYCLRTLPMTCELHISSALEQISDMPYKDGSNLNALNIKALE